MLQACERGTGIAMGAGEKGSLEKEEGAHERKVREL